MVLEIYFPNGITAFGKTVLDKPENKKELEKAVMQELGKQMSVRYSEEKEIKSKLNTETIPMNDLGIDINIID
jgi:hypothetical protein